MAARKNLFDEIVDLIEITERAVVEIFGLRERRRAPRRAAEPPSPPNSIDVPAHAASDERSSCYGQPVHGEPTYRREACAWGIRYIRFHWSKANGFGFDPHSADVDFLDGGDYDGAYPVSAERLVETNTRNVWYWRFVELVADEKDFSLHDLYAAGQPFTVHRNRECFPHGLPGSELPEVARELRLPNSWTQ